MKAKILIAAFLVVLAATVPAIAQGNGNAGRTDDGSNGNGNGRRTNTSDGNGNSGNAGNGTSNSGGGSGAGANNNPSTPHGVSVVPEKDLLAIVKSGQAVSLASLLPNVQERTGGKIIDAQLVRTERTLIYAVKILTPDGRVGIEYYNARLGTHIEVQ